MPTYDFKCPKCQDELEVFFSKFYSGMNIICPKCDIDMQKLISKPAGIHFKGSGFYETDYKNK